MREMPCAPTEHCLPSGILLRLEPNRDASLARLTIRSTNDVVSAEILELVAKPLNKDTMAAAL